MMKRLLAGLAAVLPLLPQAALAHSGHGDASGFAHGFAHPLGGTDHLLAMLAVGLLAALRGGRALWAVPAAFLGMMALGGMAGVAGLELPFVEVGIALSVAAFGLAAVFGTGMPVAALAALVGIFAVFHGHAHGAEMPGDVSGVAYGLGFLAATALLHVAGFALGVLAVRSAPRLGTLSGSAVALAGVALLVGTL